MRAIGILFAVVLSIASVTYLLRTHALNREVASGAAGFSDESLRGSFFKAGRLKCEKGICQLRINLRSQGLCQMGDLDFIRIELTNLNTEKKLLLSLGPILASEDGFAPISREVSLEDLFSGRGFDVTFPEPKGATQLGLFLCRDFAHQGECRGKKAVDLSQLIAEHAYAHKQRPDYVPPDSLYFFQYLVLQGENLLGLSEISAQSLSPAAEQARRLVVERLFGGGSELVMGEFMRAMANTRALKSLPLEISESQITAVLPKNSDGCSNRPGAGPAKVKPN